MRSLPRRRFLQQSAAAAGLATTFAVTEPVRAKSSANDVVRVAVCGVRGRGMDHVEGFLNQPDARVVAICDADEKVIGSAMKAVADRNGSDPKFYQDIRKLLEDKEVDAISIAMPNHWHALATVWACQAGKDVYVEKPASHTVVEGRRMVQAAEKYGRIVQVGTQSRSHRGMHEAIEFLCSGKLGTIYMAKGLCYKPRDSIGIKPDGPVPPGLDYDLWCGPAEMRPFNENRLHYNWHWFWNTGNGDLGNQGVHQMDVARWGLNKMSLPRAVSCSGGRFGYIDQGETPNTQSVLLRYDDCLLQFEVRGLNTPDEAGVKVGVIFFGTEGILTMPTYDRWQVYFGPKMERGPGGQGGGDHYANFIAAVRARDPKLLTAPILEGHLSSALCHLGNIAYRVGRSLEIDPSSETILGDPEANALLTRAYRPGYELPTLA
ncbi:MAG: NADH-dependent dehydrogenase [Isosphaeraceae bacterium]|nr:MAG: NADH-dependent dehydrogenase [Isosphaeraceae bacterium]